MRSAKVVLVHTYGRNYQFKYDGLLLQVIAQRFPDLRIDPLLRVEEQLWEVEQNLQIDDAEDLFTLRFLSVDLQKQHAVVFYEDSPEWCFEHRMYITEDRHAAACGTPDEAVEGG